jgi:hypothetical protein
MIPIELPHMSYEEGSRQAGRPSVPQSLDTLSISLRLATTLRMRALQVESSKCGVSSHLQGHGELHQLEKVDLVPSGGRPAGWSGLHRLSPPPRPSTPRVDLCPRSYGPNRHKTWLADQEVWTACRSLGPFGLGFGPPGSCVKYIPVVMMILIFAQLYFVIP